MFYQNVSKFAIFYVYIENPSIVFINIDQGILKGKSKVARNEKNPKNPEQTMLGFLYIKYRKFCSILLENLVVSNPHISEEWDDNKIFQKKFFW